MGLNSILDFVEGFSANHYCRLCRSTKSELQSTKVESSETLRDQLNYDTDTNFNNCSVTGVNERCIFNEVPSYHATQNCICDFMHGIIEGVARYDMAFIIKNLIDLKITSLEVLNSRIELFNKGVTEKKIHH